jgi:hypothetical protein
MLPLGGQRFVAVITVQPSSSSCVAALPALSMGSMVKIMPGCSHALAGRAVVQHLGLVVVDLADAVPQYSRTMEKRSRWATVWMASPSVAPGLTARMPATMAS